MIDDKVSCSSSGGQVWEGLVSTGPAVGGERVFVSHTSELASWPPGRSCVQAALDAIRAADLRGLDMRDFVAQDLPPAHVCEQAVRRCDVYLAVIGFRYGSIVSDRDVSYTELEFETATDAGIPRIVILLRDNSSNDLPVDNDRTRIDRFRHRLTAESGLTVTFAQNADQVEHAVYRALTELHLHQAAAITAPQAGWLMAGPEGPEGVRGHVSRRGQGQRSQSRGGDLFRGRAAALAMVTGWLQSQEPRGQILIVTGQPGAGKSAVLARAVLGLEPAAIAADQKLGLVFHARSATLSDFLDAIGAATGISMADSVPSMVERLCNGAGPPPGQWWRVVVDALDEAATDNDRRWISEALVELAGLTTTRVVVATRPLSLDSATRFAPGSVLPALGVYQPSDPNLVDLDDDRFFDSAGLRQFTVALLRQEGATIPTPSRGAWSAYRADPTLCDRLASIIATKAGRNHLVAALTADPLSQSTEPLDPDAPDFDPTTLPSSIGDALTKYLQRLPEPRGVLVRGLLTALAYARGPGVGNRLWILFSAALGYSVTTQDLDLLRSGAAADYLLQTIGTGQQRVVRLFHQALADELLTTRFRPEDETRLLTCLFPTRPETWLTATPYAKSFTADHAAAAHRLRDLLGDPAYLTVADLTRLMPRLSDIDADDDAGSVSTVAVLRMAALRGHGLSPERRGRLFQLAAIQLGMATVAGRFHQRSNLTIAWAHSRGAPHQTLTGHVGGVTAVAVGRVGDRDVIVSGGEDRTVLVWDANTGQTLGQPLAGHTSRVRAVAVGRVGNVYVIASGDERTVRAWDALSGRPLSSRAEFVEAMAVDRVGDRDVIVLASRDRAVRVWDADSDPLLLNQPHSGRPDWAGPLGAGRIGDRRVIVSASHDWKVRIWDSPGSEVKTMELWEPSIAWATGTVAPPHTGWVEAVAVGRVGDRDVIVVGSGDLTVRVWDARTGQLVGEALSGHTGGVHAVAVGRVGDRDVIVSGSADQTVRVWEPPTTQLVGHQVVGHAGSVDAVALGRVGHRAVIVSCGEDRTVRVWDAHTGQPLGQPLVGHTGLVAAVAIGRVGDRDVIVSGGGDWTVRVWDAISGELLGQPLGGHTGLVAAVAIGRVGDRDVIVSGSHDRLVNVWRMRWGRFRLTAQIAHTSGIGALAMGRVGDRDVIVSGGDDRTVRVWDTRTGQSLGQFTGHTDRVSAVAMGRVGDRDVIVSGGDDRTVRVWDTRNSDSQIQDTLDPVNAIAVNGRMLGFAAGSAVCSATLD
jgi:WD40 repeat protein